MIDDILELLTSNVDFGRLDGFNKPYSLAYLKLRFYPLFALFGWSVLDLFYFSTFDLSLWLLSLQ